MDCEFEFLMYSDVRKSDRVAHAIGMGEVYGILTRPIKIQQNMLS